jgi:hypothetical protein
LETSFVGGQGSIPGFCSLQQYIHRTRDRRKVREQKWETLLETEGGAGDENEAKRQNQKH